MDNGFIDILKQLVKEQGNAALTDTKKCKAFLADYTKNEYKKEIRLIVQAVEAGVAKTIDGADDLVACKKVQIRDLKENYGLDSTVAMDIVNALALVLRGDTTMSTYKSIFDAAQRGTVEDIKFFLEQTGVNTKDENGRTPLALAVRRYDDNNVELVKFLISKGADVNAKDKKGKTLLHEISYNTKKEEKDEHLQDFFQKSMIDIIEIANILISAGADVNARADDGGTPLINAAMQGNLDFFKALVSRGADVNAKTSDGVSALSTAEYSGNAAIVKFLTKGERNLSDEDLMNAQEAAKRAINHYMKNDFDGVIKEYTEAIRLDPNNAAYYDNRGSAYVHIGQHEQGISDLTVSIRLNPNNDSAYRFRGMAYSQLGNHAQAIKDLTESIRLNPNEHFSYISRGVAYSELRQNDKARSDFEKVISMNPGDEIIAFVNGLLGEEK
jgi:ankyrin repeat protein